MNTHYFGLVVTQDRIKNKIIGEIIGIDSIVGNMVESSFK